MKRALSHPVASTRAARAYSLMEVLLAVAIMGVIVAALYTVFNFTQKALRSNVTQTDIAESGRATMDLLTRQLAQIEALDLPAATSPAGASLTNLFRVPGGPNLFISLADSAVNLTSAWFRSSAGYTSTVQATISAGVFRTNHRHAVYFVTRQNQDIAAHAFWVQDAAGGVGALTYFTTNWHRSRLGWTNLFTSVVATPASNFFRLADGVIHFRVTPYDSDGLPVTWFFADRYTNQVHFDTMYLAADPLGGDERGKFNTETRVAFMSNALPAAVEVEVGFLEPGALAEYRALPADSPFARRYLTNHAGQVQLFRQRIPLWQAPPLQAVQAFKP